MRYTNRCLPLLHLLSDAVCVSVCDTSLPICDVSLSAFVSACPSACLCVCQSVMSVCVSVFLLLIQQREVTESSNLVETFPAVPVIRSKVMVADYSIRLLYNGW